MRATGHRGRRARGRRRTAATAGSYRANCVRDPRQDLVSQQDERMRRRHGRLNSSRARWNTGRCVRPQRDCSARVAVLREADVGVEYQETPRSWTVSASRAIRGGSTRAWSREVGPASVARGTGTAVGGRGGTNVGVGVIADGRGRAPSRKSVHRPSRDRRRACRPPMAGEERRSIPRYSVDCTAPRGMETNLAIERAEVGDAVRSDGPGPDRPAGGECHKRATLVG